MIFVPSVGERYSLQSEGSGTKRVATPSSAQIPLPKGIPSVTGSPVKKAKPESSAKFPLFDLLQRNFAKLKPVDQAILSFCQFVAEHPERDNVNRFGIVTLTYIRQMMNTAGDELPPPFLERLVVAILADLCRSEKVQQLTQLPSFGNCLLKKKDEWLAFSCSILESPHYRVGLPQEQAMLLFKECSEKFPEVTSFLYKQYFAPLPILSEPLLLLLARPSITNFELCQVILEKISLKKDESDRCNQAFYWIITLFLTCEPNEVAKLVNQVTNLQKKQEWKHLNCIHKDVADYFLLETQKKTHDYYRSAWITCALVLPLMKHSLKWFLKLAQVLEKACYFYQEGVLQGLQRHLKFSSNNLPLIAMLIEQIRSQEAREYVLSQLGPFLFEIDPPLYGQLTTYFLSKSTDGNLAKVAAELLALPASKNDKQAWNELSHLLPYIACEDPEWTYLFCARLDSFKTDLRLAPILSKCLTVIDLTDPYFILFKDWEQHFKRTNSLQLQM